MTTPTRKLAAILAADVAGYSKLMGEDETGTLAALRELRYNRFQPTVTAHRGEVVKSMGDGWLVEFASVVDAVNCALQVQENLANHEIIKLRIGIHIGDIVHEDEDIYGDGVNIAARLQEISEPGGVALSGRARDFLDGKLANEFRDAGEKQLKNIAEAVRVFVSGDSETETSNNASSVDAPLSLPNKPSIAVLSFDNMSADPEQEYFSDGMTEDIITALSKYAEFTVIARNTTFTYKGAAVDVKQVGRELDVRYVLEGSVRKGGDSVRVTVQLIDALSGNHLWAERYDRKLEDIFAVQDEITISVVGAIEPMIYDTESRRSQRKPPQSLAAWECCMRALTLVDKLTQEDFEAADRLLDQAIAADPDYAQSYGLKAFLRSTGALNGWGGHIGEALSEAMVYAEQALALDANDHWAHYAAGFVHMVAKRPNEGIAEMRLSISINPNFSMGHLGLGMALAFNGMAEEALKVTEFAHRINPRSPFSYNISGTFSICHFFAGRDEEAVRFARESLRERPDYLTSTLYLAAAQGKLGLVDESRHAVETVLRILPGFTLARHERAIWLGHAPYRDRYIDGLRKAGLPE